jgi:hypothetical protein
MEQGGKTKNGLDVVGSGAGLIWKWILLAAEVAV